MKRLTDEQLKMISYLKERGMKPTAISKETGININTISYHFYPNVREGSKEYRKKPDVMKRRREYLKGYCKRPYARQRQSEYEKEHYTKRKLVIDLFTDFKTGYSFEGIRGECGGRPEKIREDLKAYEDAGVLIKTIENDVEIYRLNKKFEWFLKKKESRA